MQHPVTALGQATSKRGEIQRLHREKEKNLKSFLYVGCISPAHWHGGKAENVDGCSFPIVGV